MFSLLCGCVQDYFYGLYDSLHGLLYIFELDKDEEFVAVNSIPQQRPQPRTVLQQRREQRGTPNRPAEQIIRQRPRVWKRILQCISLNLILALALQIFVLIFGFVVAFITPSAEHIANLAGRFLVLPFFLFTRIVMALWFSDIAGACMRGLKLQDAPPVDLRYLVADLVMSLLLGLVFLVQSVVVVYLPLPVIANLISAIHMSLLNSMYCFEYLWSARGSSLNERIFRLEKRWCYFAGFGTFLTFASTFFENFLLNGCVFGAIFPFFIISSYKANWKRETLAKDLPAVHIFTPSMLLTNRVVSFFSNTVTSP